MGSNKVHIDDDDDPFDDDNDTHRINTDVLLLLTPTLLKDRIDTEVRTNDETAIPPSSSGNCYLIHHQIL